jgi:hypothetical protein
MSDCHIPHLIAFLSRVSMDDLENLRPDAELLAANCPLLPGKALAAWVEYMCRFKKIYELSKSRQTPAAEVQNLLDWIHDNADSKLFVLAHFDRFFNLWFEDIKAGKDWQYFTENDWFTEYQRHRIFPR